MIKKEVLEVCRLVDYKGGLRIEISVPEGEKLCERTFNPRLGIVGHISCGFCSRSRTASSRKTISHFDFPSYHVKLRSSWRNAHWHESLELLFTLVPDITTGTWIYAKVSYAEENVKKEIVIEGGIGVADCSLALQCHSSLIWKYRQQYQVLG
mgnify:CR=1 FL=1